MRHCIGLLLLLACSIAADTGAADPGDEPLTVGVEAYNYPPLSTLVDGAYHGPIRELLDRFGAETGIEFRYRAFTVPRLYTAYLDRRSVALKFPDDPRWQAPRRAGVAIEYSDPVLPYTDGLWLAAPARAQTGYRLRSIAMPAAYTALGFEAEIAAGTIRVESVLDPEAAMRMVLIERVDAAYLSEAFGIWLQRRKPEFGALVFDESRPYASGWYRLSARDNPGIIGRFNAFLARNQDFVIEWARANAARNLAAEHPSPAP